MDLMSQEEESKVVIIDGSNVAHAGSGEQASLRSITLICDKLREEGYEPVIVADAALRHQIDDKEAYEELVTGGQHQAGAGRHRCRLFHPVLRAGPRGFHRFQRQISGS
jgi:hypothetical protein